MEKSAFVYIGLTIVTLLLGLCVQNKEYVPGYLRGGREPGERVGCDRQLARNRVAVFAIFCLLAGVSACRIAVGNDYWVYWLNFQLIEQNRHVASEAGFNLIVLFFRYLFDGEKARYLSIFAFFSLTTVFFFVRALRDQAEDFAFSLFLLMTGGFYFNSLNSVRYYFALALAVFSVKYVLRGEYGKFLLLILAGALIHKSILLVIPVYMIARFLASARLKRVHYVVGGIFLASLIFGQKLYREIIFFFYPYYRDSDFDTGQLSYVNILKCVCVLGLSLLCYRESIRDNVKNRFYFFLNLFGLVVYCLGSFIPEVSRVGYYMIITQIFLIPGLIGGMKNKTLRRLVWLAVVGGFTCYFVFLLKGMYAVDIRLLPYRNWIFD
jgi:hypothetical protein